MSLKEKLDEVQAMFINISQLLIALPHEDSQPIKEELDYMQRRYEHHLSNTERHRQLDTFHSELLNRLPVQRLLTRQKHYVPALAKLMDMVPEDEDHKDIVWVRKWLVHPEQNLEEAKYFFIYATRAVLEVLAIKYNVLTDQCEQFVWDLNSLFENFIRPCTTLQGYSYSVLRQRDKHIGFVSRRFDLWIIHIISDPEMCPNSVIRLKCWYLWKLLKVNDLSYEQILMTFFSAFTTLDRHQENNSGALIKEMYNALNGFDFDISGNSLLKFGKQLAEKIRHNRKTRKLILMQDISYDYAMGLKRTLEPREILGITAILKYISDDTEIEYKAFQEKPNKERLIKKINESFWLLYFFVSKFKYVLEEPEMLYVAAECVMNTMENAVRSKYKLFQDTLHLKNDILRELYLVDAVFQVFELHPTDSEYPNYPGLVGQEIIRRYKERICRLRLQIPRVFMEGCYSLIQVIYNGEY